VCLGSITDEFSIEWLDEWEGAGLVIAGAEQIRAE
jgi:hypothetical protein